MCIDTATVALALRMHPQFDHAATQSVRFRGTLPDIDEARQLFDGAPVVSSDGNSVSSQALPRSANGVSIHPPTRTLHVEAFGHALQLDLHLNDGLLAPNYKEIRYIIATNPVLSVCLKMIVRLHVRAQRDR